MTYLCIDIRDTIEKFVIKKISAATILDDSLFIDFITRLFKFGKRYVIEIPATKLDIPVFFPIKENKDYIVIEYCKIDFKKYGTGHAGIEQRWEKIKDIRTIENNKISKIYPFDENKKYKYAAYFFGKVEI